MTISKLREAYEIAIAEERTSRRNGTSPWPKRLAVISPGPLSL